MSSENLSGKTAVCVGGSQGIGAGAAIEFARCDASVIIVGRQEDLMKQVVEELRKANGSDNGKIFDYIKADVSTVAGMKDAVKQIASKTGTRGVDYLVQTQGGPANGTLNITSDGFDAYFAVQSLSRFALPYLLAKEGVLKGGVVNVSNPGRGAESVDIDDLDLQKLAEAGEYGRGLKDVLKISQQTSSILDAITLEFTARFSLSAAHLYPGIVATKSATNSNLPFPLPLIASIFLPALSLVGVAATPKSFAPIPVGLAVSGKSGMFTPKGTEQAPGHWAAVEANRKVLWDKLESMLQ